ncbi:hypothetical protein DN820_01720 [Stutzerimonas nosocomialis]|uniref:Uncharacterized protein n=1 Tax=Stutzerimonas nosocomialis TaxID=1056496 RepID=A0A5R9QII0_9GAMM|nr:hypothetical protein [Stutzerimonas nosocomialis]TLX65057.1 hypothetical protein DN820_01720 [Stutzerimonas nosocomialis]
MDANLEEQSGQLLEALKEADAAQSQAPDPQTVEIRSPRENGVGGIDCELCHPVYGFIPFTSRERGDNELVRVVYERLRAGEAGPIAPYAGGRYVPPEVTMRQARLALLSAGLLSQVNQALAGMAGDEGEAARIEWDYSSVMRRDKPFVQGIGAMLGLTPAQIDDLFIAAAAIE